MTKKPQVTKAKSCTRCRKFKKATKADPQRVCTEYNWELKLDNLELLKTEVMCK